jgi:hypothetical protein
VGVGFGGSHHGPASVTSPFHSAFYLSRHPLSFHLPTPPTTPHTMRLAAFALMAITLLVGAAADGE